MTSVTLPLLGGLLIGAAAVLLLGTLGRIAGISGILWTAVSDLRGSTWRWLFLFGLIAGAGAFHLVSGQPEPTASLSSGHAIIGGLLVGIGVKLGSGCTSGHGVCGIGRLSPRSLLATIIFMAFGIITVFIMRHL